MHLLNKRLAHYKVIPVIAIDRAEDILPLGEQLVANGLPVAEITFRSDAAEEAVRLLRKAYPDMLIGAGTILNENQVIAAKEAGVDFIVSPGLNPNTINACLRHGIDIIPGVNNPSLVEQAIELGVTTLKFFPAEASGGLNMLKSLLGPYQQIKIMPTGGINPENVHEYLSLPAVFACGGTWMVDKKLVNDGNWTEIGRLVREVVKSVA
ncbi:2-dehydro-3-deoxyphosphogluconate aldolase [Vibrio sp. 10N.286.49.B3]|uniref:bifunctional 4-hydroxy-2-oxoglutarate aldolase/2-dehydro-3-deoxy-phosphogluconate aldolase n=1 Tax=Vibrio sp. 10N.286.49.B3 TaxID=1880855 RepID=UPI000C8241E1|nr:bifunctional 4-hydroxy-2-oxoglutarate aldolase/2-dehydro-3-deoxy-phosphogluconate aldolase [Vibrio sp. 10N.286.49.B3]PMH45323.1 2-dehydro-3-deoxyphosphogluconate aldolase [Vibrio sp. 10N.286.49.B3]